MCFLAQDPSGPAECAACAPGGSKPVSLLASGSAVLFQGHQAHHGGQPKGLPGLGERAFMFGLSSDSCRHEKIIQTERGKPLKGPISSVTDT